MAVNFTESQEKAISSRRCSLIVSAAAGSGKTAVLVERVIRMICDRDDPCDIDELLVVTFTNAAATEMKEKISAALLRRISENPSDMRLRRQLSLLSGARIQTVHSFCLDLIREHFALVDVPADFGIADEAAASELREQAMEEVLEELYASGDNDFEALCAALSEEKGDNALVNVMIEVYDKLISHPDSIRKLAEFTSEEGQQKWKPYLLEEAGKMITSAAESLARSYEVMRSDPVVFEKYSTAFEDCLSFAENAKKAINGGWNEAYNIFSSFKNPSLASVREKGHDEIKEAMKTAKNSFAEAVGNITDRVLAMSEEEAEVGKEANLAALRGLRMAVEAFFERFSALKLSRRLLDYSDLEHYALKLLRNEAGEPSEIAMQISESLREILVDEYQDTNDIQDTIFKMVSCRAGGAFYVGDVKQSIYRFRMAKPEIFMEKYLTYEDHCDDAEGRKLRLSLNRNFRSRREVLETCNHVFRAIMSRSFGDIDYTEDEALHPAAPYTGEVKSHFEIIDMQGAAYDDDSPEKAEAEAIYVANTIASMLKTEQVTDPFSGETRPAEYGDFAILLSSFANKSGYFIRELERLGIPVKGGQKDYWSGMEILVMMSFLRVLDNRRQDIPLVGLMRSPFFFFTADELAEIRLAAKGVPIYDALLEYAVNNEKAADFVRTIDRYVSFVPDMSASQMIRMIYSEKSAMAVFGAMDNGEERKAKLRAFYDLALSFESGGHKSIFDFIRHAETLMENNKSISIDEGDGVKIMSVHKSKGLEFPFVFLPDLAKAFNFDDTRKQAVIHDKMGIGLRIRDRKLRCEYRMPMHMAVSSQIRRELASEEVRKLYVAMTRAKEKLIMSCSLRDAGKAMDEIAREVELNGITPGWLYNKSNSAAWILAANSAERCPCMTISVTPYTSVERKQHFGTERAADEIMKSPSEALMQKMRLGREEYPYAAVSALPSKLTPAGTKKLRDEDSSVIGETENEFYVSGEKSPLTAAQRGSAVHLFLQKADLAACGSS
ncbi:MAG: helicase-exonuclease AddAB subunit AddA, partial [Clostridia bacterium]|nr:helicase-exonuclease AddAB subunit AddA [Clostridia bacterium]